MSLLDGGRKKKLLIFYNFYEPWSGDVNQYCTVLIPFGGETGVKKMALLPDKVGARGRC